MKATLSNDLESLRPTARRLPAILLASGLGLGTSLALPAYAGCSANPLSWGSCAKDGVDFIGDEVIDPMVDGATNAYNAFDNTIISAAGECLPDVESCASEVGDWMVTQLNALSRQLYLAAANLFVNGRGDTLVDLFELIEDLAVSRATEFQQLAEAVQDNDLEQIADLLPPLMLDIATGPNAGVFDALIDDLEDEGAGSLLIMFTAGGGYVAVSGSFDWGLAIDIDYLKFVKNVQVLSLDYVQGNTELLEAMAEEYQRQQGTTPVATVFKAAGAALGPSMGGSLDTAIGYHVANPDSVGGPSIDVAIEAAFYGGGGFGIGFDASTLAVGQLPQVVTAAVGLKAGAEVEASVDGSFAELLGQVCFDWTQMESETGGWSFTVDDELVWNVLPILFPDDGGLDLPCPNPLVDDILDSLITTANSLPKPF